MKPYSFIHTADLHIGRKPKVISTTPAANAAYNAQPLDALHCLLSCALCTNADALLIAGDLFDDEPYAPHIADPVINAIAAAAPLAVYIAPGNHDRLSPRSHYARPNWPPNAFIAQTDRLSIFETTNPDVQIQANAWTADRRIADAFDLAPNPDARPAAQQILLSHLTLTDHQPATWKAYAPTTSDFLSKLPFAYAALGHLHYNSRSKALNGAHIVYPGSPVPCDHPTGPAPVAFRVTINGPETDVYAFTPPMPAVSEITLEVTPQNALRQITNFHESHRTHRHPPQFLTIRLIGTLDALSRTYLTLLRNYLKNCYIAFAIVDHCADEQKIAPLLESPTPIGTFLRQINQKILAATDDDQRNALDAARQHAIHVALSKTT